VRAGALKRLNAARNVVGKGINKLDRYILNVTRFTPVKRNLPVHGSDYDMLARSNSGIRPAAVGIR